MDEVIWRFRHLIESIFGRVDSESLVKCRGVGELWCNHLDAQKFLKIRMIKASVNQFHEILLTMGAFLSFPNVYLVLIATTFLYNAYH